MNQKQLQLCLLIFVSITCRTLIAHEDDTKPMDSFSGQEEKRPNKGNDPKPTQLALESIAEQEQPPKKLAFNNSPPRAPINLPPRNNQQHFPHKNLVKKNKQPLYDNKNSYNGPPPPLPHSQQAMDKYDTGIGGGSAAGGDEIWPSPAPDMPKIISLDVKCEKNLMKVYIGFDKPFYGIVFSKGHYSNVHCVHLPAGLGRTSATFEIGIHACGTLGNTENGLYGYGAESGSGTYFENIVVIQYDPQVQEVWDQARKLRCTWHDQYEKSVTFRPFPVDMLDVVRTDFAGDNVGCWMQIQVGKGPWASEVSGLVKIGQTMTMVLAIKDDDSKFDMLVRNCMAHDGKRAPIQLVDQKGCVTRPKLMSRFTKIKNFGASASVLSYAHFQAFKFPDSMEVHFQCTIQICRYQCPDQCSDLNYPGSNNILELAHNVPDNTYGPSLPIESYLHSAQHPRDERRLKRSLKDENDPEKEVGLNRVIRVVSNGDLTFTLEDNNNNNNSTITTTQQPPTIVFPAKDDINSGLICMTTPGFAVTLVVLLGILFIACLISAVLCFRLRPLSVNSNKKKDNTTKSCFYS